MSEGSNYHERTGLASRDRVARAPLGAARSPEALPVRAERQPMPGGAQAHAALSTFVTYAIATMCMYGFVLREAAALAAASTFSTAVTSGIVVGTGAAFLVMMRRSGYPLATYGLTTAGARASIAESLAWTAGFLILLTLAKAMGSLFLPALRGEPLFAFPLINAATPGAVLLDGLLYTLVAPVQEVIARGALQGSLQRFLVGRYVTARAIGLSTLMFAAMHLHISTALAVASLAPSLLWGLLFARHRTLVGPIVSHLIIGWYVLYALGLPGVWE